MDRTILVVEDQEDNRKILRDLLTSKGYRVIEVENGYEGIQKTVEHHPDLILMDIQLPGIDGYEVIKRIKTDPKTGKIPIIAVTSYALSGDSQKAFEAGCDGYVAKPYSPKKLLSMIEETLP